MKGIDFRVILGIVTLAVCFIVFPIVLDGTDTILSNNNISNYTGLSAIVKVAPMLVMIAIIFGGGLLVWKGAKETRARRKSYKKSYAKKP